MMVGAFGVLLPFRIVCGFLRGLGEWPLILEMLPVVVAGGAARRRPQRVDGRVRLGIGLACHLNRNTRIFDFTKHLTARVAKHTYHNLQKQFPTLILTTILVYIRIEGFAATQVLP